MCDTNREPQVTIPLNEYNELLTRVNTLTERLSKEGKENGLFWGYINRRWNHELDIEPNRYIGRDEMIQELVVNHKHVVEVLNNEIQYLNKYKVHDVRTMTLWQIFIDRITGRNKTKM